MSKLAISSNHFYCHACKRWVAPDSTRCPECKLEMFEVLAWRKRQGFEQQTPEKKPVCGKTLHFEPKKKG